MWAEHVMTETLHRGFPRGRLRYQQSSLFLIHRMADAVLILISLWAAILLAGGHWSHAMAIIGTTGAAMFCFLAEAKNLYRSWRIEQTTTQFWHTFEAWLGAAGAALVALYLQHDVIGFPQALLLWFLGTPVLLGVSRISFHYALRRARAQGWNTRNLAIAGNGELARHVAHTVAENPWMGFRIVGLFDDLEADDDVGPNGKSPRSLDALADLARTGDLDAVYIAFPPGRSERRAGSLLRQLADSTVSVYIVQDRRSRASVGEGGSRQIVPDLWQLDLLHSTCVNLGGIKAISVYESPFLLGSAGWIKRVEDIVVGCVALLLLALPMAAIAVGVKLSGRGPVLFKQRRYGLDGKEIMVWKFRSMTVCENGDKIVQAKKEDARVTRFGAFIRRTSLDELPQFINVLQGSMSIVGPRPHAVAHNEHYRSLIGGYMLRHKVKPGITGWAQINGWRGETDSVDKMGRRVDFDLEYIRHWSLWLDIRIILMTAIRGFVQKNAY
jgi:undecaprenyl-phosphate glucose phosphotransferase